MERKNLFLLIVLAIITVLTGINPANRLPWILEAGLVWLFVIVLIITYKKFQMPNYVYVLLFIFLLFPLIGGYYSFDKVPYGNLLDFSNNGFNHYDRLVHLLFGLLVTPFAFELIKKLKIKNKTWAFILPIALILAMGAIYELIEWASGLIFAPETIESWVGLKGDNFDSQKDMLLGFIGSVISMGIIIIKRKKLK